ncbi:fimbria/pilus outer membrane usher protein [Acinetobacter apis]|nr:fimbria/pilus outer membrane usher protein [Acinetobacter apis]
MYNNSAFKTLLMVAVSHCILTHSAQAEDTLSFDSAALFGQANKNVDLTAFNTENTVPIGRYILNVAVNDIYNGQLNIEFWQPDPKKPATLCLDNALLKKIGVRNDIIAQFANQRCITIKELNPDARYVYDDASLALSLSIPLVVLNNRPNGYIDPQLFDQGVHSAYLSYNFNHYTDHSKAGDYSSVNFLSLTGGINFAGFNYRHAGAFESNSSQDFARYYASLNVISHDIVAISSRISFGDFLTNAYYLASTPIRGIELTNDPNMRPWSVQSYAPTIEGVANSNALVSVFQNGQKIYERTVPVGAFQIKDLTTLATNGDLTVQVTEQGGEKKQFIVPMQGNSNLIRPGQFNYNLALGRYKLERKVLDEQLLQATAEYGLFNNFTMHTGANISDHYRGYLLGAGLNSLFGGLTFDAEYGHAELNEANKTGWKAKLNYRYTFLPSNLSVTISTQKLSEDYISYGNTISLLNNASLTQDEIDNFYLTFRLKDQTSLTLRQQLGKGFGTLYVTGTQSSYWNNNKQYKQYLVGYSNFWKRINYSINLSQAETINSTKSKSFYISASFPLYWKNSMVNSNSVYQHTETNDLISTGISGTSGDRNQMNYAINTNYDQNNQSSAVNSSLNYLFPRTSLGVTYANARGQTQYGLTLQGGAVLHPYGLTLTNNLSDTFTIIHAKDAQGTEVSNAWGITLDRFGNAIYPLVDPYHSNTLSINGKNLPLDVLLTNNQSQVIPRRYSSTLLTFETKKTSNILLNVDTPHHVQIPMGIEVKNSANQTIAIMGQSNQLFIDAEMSLKEPLTVKWGVDHPQMCVIPPSYELLSKKTIRKKFQMLNVVCQ